VTYGIEWPWPGMTEKLGPLHGGDLVVFAGYTGNGKTLALTNLFWKWAKETEHTLQYLSTENAAKVPYYFAGLELGYTRIKMRSDADAKTRAGEFCTSRWPETLETGGVPTNAHEAIKALRSSTAEIRCLDYIGGLTYEQFRSDREGLVFAIREAKLMAEDLGTVVIIGAQLAMRRDDPLKNYRHSQVDDVQGSSAIHHAADHVLTTRRLLSTMDGVREDVVAVRAGKKPTAILRQHERGMELCVAKARDGTRPGRLLFGFEHPTHLEYPSERFRVLDESEIGY